MEHSHETESQPVFRVVPNTEQDTGGKKSPKAAKAPAITKAALLEIIGAANGLVAMSDANLALSNQESDRLASVLVKLFAQYPSIAKFAAGSNRLAVWVELGIVTYGIVSVRVAYLEAKRATANADVSPGGARHPNGNDGLGQNIFGESVFEQT